MINVCPYCRRIARTTGASLLFRRKLEKPCWRRIPPIRHYAQAPSSKLIEFRPLERIRNIGISAHIDSGKTTVTERILYYSGRIDSMHEVKGKDEVGATMDFMDLERQRGITIQSAATYIDWKGTTVNIIDTPGHVDFTVEVERALRVLDGAILVMCGVAGVQSQTHTVCRQMERYNIPFITFINKLDRENSNAIKGLNGLRKNLRFNASLIHLPIGKEKNFCGVVDLINEVALYFEGDDGLNIRKDDIPADYKAQAHDLRQELIERASGACDVLGNLFIEERTPTAEQLIQGIRKGVISRQFVPVLCGSALKNKGIQPLLDAAIMYLPNPSEVKNFANVHGKSEADPVEKIQLKPDRNNVEPLVAFAFKLEMSKYGQLTYFRIYQGRMTKGDTLRCTRTGEKVRLLKLVRMHANSMEDIEEAFAGDICATFGIECITGDTFTTKDNWKVAMEGMHIPEPVVSMSLKVVGGNKDNFTKAIKRFTKEDPTYRYEYNAEAEEAVVSGMGELHLEIYTQRIKNEYNCECVLGKPKVAFRETLLEPCRFDHKHKRQTGGQGQYGHLIGWCEPLYGKDMTNFIFSDESRGGCIPKNFMVPIQKGLRETMKKGPLIGHPVCGIRFRLLDGDHHIVDSTEIAFINAAKETMLDIYSHGKWILIEPIMTVEVTCPLENEQAVTAALSKRLAQPQTHSASDVYYTAMLEVPLNTMFGFTAELRMLTKGKGEFTMEFNRYAHMSPEMQQNVFKEYSPPEEIEVKHQKRKSAK